MTEARQRTAALILRKLRQFDAGRIELSGLVRDIEALIASLDDGADPRWVAQLESAWWQLELVNAYTHEERRSTLSTHEKADVECARRELERLATREFH